MEKHRNGQICNSPRRRDKEGNREELARQSRTPGKRRNHTKSTTTILLAESPTMARTICQGVRDMSTKQKPYAPTPNTPIQNPSTRKRTTIHAGGNGPHHGTTQEPRLRQYPHYRRPRMHPRSHIPTMYGQYHRTPNSTAILSTRVPLVWTSPKTNHRLRPSLHITLRPSPR